jgi:hypothetical protein
MVFRIFEWLIRTLRIRHDGSTRDESVDKNDVKNITDLPATCLRGLRKPEWVDDSRLVATEAFLPNRKSAETRQDHGFETSVNWEDDSNVESFTLADQGNAMYGAARLSTSHIAHASQMVAAVKGALSCERKILSSKNLYHGNIVYAAHVSKRLEKQLAAMLALSSEFVPPLVKHG